jgi:hypothetical protein
MLGNTLNISINCFSSRFSKSFNWHLRIRRLLMKITRCDFWILLSSTLKSQLHNLTVKIIQKLLRQPWLRFHVNQNFSAWMWSRMKKQLLELMKQNLSKNFFDCNSVKCWSGGSLWVMSRDWIWGSFTRDICVILEIKSYRIWNQNSLIKSNLKSNQISKLDITSKRPPDFSLAQALEPTQPKKKSNGKLTDWLCAVSDVLSPSGQMYSLLTETPESEGPSHESGRVM